jgi:hypothetical protein
MFRDNGRRRRSRKQRSDGVAVQGATKGSGGMDTRKATIVCDIQKAVLLSLLPSGSVIGQFGGFVVLIDRLSVRRPVTFADRFV